MINQKILAEKLLQLRCRIEDWTHIHGWENMDNRTIRKNKEGSIVWKQTDWEFVDNMHNTIYNDHEFGYNGDTVKKLNEMWDRYRPYDESSFMGIGVPGSVLINNEKC